MCSTNEPPTEHFDFDEQLRKGAEDELFQDSVYAAWFDISRVPTEWQKLGIDRKFICKKTRRVFTVEYKWDYGAGISNNLFMETVSVDRDSIPGWVYTSHAQWLSVHVPPGEKNPIDTIYLLNMATIKTHIEEWKKRFAEKSVKNKEYHTKGIPVPIGIVMKTSCRVIVIEYRNGKWLVQTKPPKATE